MSAEEKQAAPTATFVFLASLTSGQSVKADSKVRKHGSVSLSPLYGGGNGSIKEVCFPPVGGTEEWH